MSTDNTNKPDCFHCVHFAVSWDPRSPKACKLFGFKSAYMPSTAVFNSTGTACEGFERKNAQK